MNGLLEFGKVGTAPYTDRHFDVYGYRFVTRGSNQSLCDGISEDFAFFQCDPGKESVSIELLESAPPFDSVPVSDAVLYTPRNVVYADGDTRYVDFHGKALGIHHRRTGDYRIYSLDRHLLYEAAYLFLLAQIGSFHDRRGLHRLHALAMHIGGRSVLIILPMGGGKSTLGLSLLQHSDCKILSDDSPFIDSKGRAHAFPLRLGLLPGTEDQVPAHHKRHIERMEFGPKIAVDYKYFAPRVARSAEPGLVLIGRRTMNRECRITDACLLDGLRACVAPCILGVGLFQGIEFVLERSGWEILGKAGLAWSRARNCCALLRQSKVAFAHFGRDAGNNAGAVVEYARQVLR